MNKPIPVDVCYYKGTFYCMRTGEPLDVDFQREWFIRRREFPSGRERKVVPLEPVPIQPDEPATLEPADPKEEQNDDSPVREAAKLPPYSPVLISADEDARDAQRRFAKTLMLELAEYLAEIAKTPHKRADPRCVDEARYMLDRIARAQKAGWP